MSACRCGQCVVKPRSSFVRSLSLVDGNDSDGSGVESVDLVIVSVCRVCGDQFSRPMAMGAGLAAEVLRISAVERRAEYRRQAAAADAARGRAAVARAAALRAIGDAREIRDLARVPR